jgi:hypothetical protein
MRWRWLDVTELLPHCKKPNLDPSFIFDEHGAQFG